MIKKKSFLERLTGSIRFEDNEENEDEFSTNESGRKISTIKDGNNGKNNNLDLQPFHSPDPRMPVYIPLVWNRKKY